MSGIEADLTVSSSAGLPPADDNRSPGWFGHPRGLSVLFFTEMWERLSYYGMRSLLVLYMVAPRDQGGLGFSTASAAAIYGWYTALVYTLSLPGGIIADRWLGQYRAVLYGACIISAGHFCLAFSPLPCFFGGLGLIILGTGLLKPNMSSMVGSLYEPGDPRRDGGFSIFYLGVNVGATLAPFVCGTLGQKAGWHYGFSAAGVGMILGVVQYWFGRSKLQPALDRLENQKRQARKSHTAARRALSSQELKRLYVVLVLFVFSAIFWAAFEQAGSSLNLFADRWTDLRVASWSFPSSWFQALNPIFIIIFAPIFSWLWNALGQRQPSSPAKFAYGLLLLSFGFLLLIPASSFAQSAGHRVSPLWLTGVYLLHTLGELCLSPVGLSMVTKLAPPQLVGSMMGFWYLSNAAGNKLAGWIAGYFDQLPLPQLFGRVFLMTFAAGVVLVALVRPLRRLMGGAR
jgi:proton-dependent oligopeptide transporter, POT family